MAAPPRDKTTGRSLRGVPQVPAARPATPRAPSRLPVAPAVAGPRVLALVLWPVILTLAVTLVRLVGELRGGSPAWFSRLPGGGLAIVGIAWLAPFVGAYFGWCLTRAGVRSPGVATVAGWPAGALLLGLAIGYGLERVAQPSWTGTLVLWAGVAVLVAMMSFVTWPALGWPLLVYAASARLAVAFVMAFAIWKGWGTHYDALPPGFPGLPPMARWLWTGLLPQTTIWIAFTLAVGMTGAAAGVWLASRRPR